MNDDATCWFSPAPDAGSSSRLSLDFGLRAADLFFRERVVPGLGRVWFVRQLSWPLAALALREELARGGANVPRASVICHGIEALACKLEYRVDPQEPSRRILGRRAFGRDPDFEVWSFERLRQATYYVRNTQRQAATRAIRAESGLGFARGGRFDRLELEPIGLAMANACLDQPVGKGGTSLRKWLIAWITHDRAIPDRPATLLRALSPESPSASECALVHGRLFGTVAPAARKRERLAEAIGRAADLPDIERGVVANLRAAGHSEQAAEIIAARAFGAVLDRARDAVARLARAVEPARDGVKVATLAGDAGLRRAIGDLRSTCDDFMRKARTAGVTETTSGAFAHAVVAADEVDAIRLLVRRAGEMFALADGAVRRSGPLFRVIGDSDENDDLGDGAASIEPDRTSPTGRTFRIANLHALLRDIDGRETR